ncbi:succinate--CoA ligase subunit beta [Leekyejoonella antrihumi]|uniref:Succinate--CoA ligase n=1 Tax=Leekyejoonella antrihumi TaxID=1660198 RepID=A0A563DXQ2_9MICO|nr:ATP-grasp domain-containing protein [Leekyejoonella antrihumi]TWP34985.1 succinate--CoA ligase [Leekyejoonella antrihumi]
MNLLEHLGKRLLRDAGLTTPRGTVVVTPDEAAEAASALGPNLVLKSQIPAGKRGKSGGIRFPTSVAEVRSAAEDLLGAEVAGHRVSSLLVEQSADIARELYAAVLNDAASKKPTVIFSTQGGMDIEEVSSATPDSVKRCAIDVRKGFTAADAALLLAETDLAASEQAAVGRALMRLYQLYSDVDAELVEVNPLVLTAGGTVVALDAKISLDPGALARHRDLVRDLTDELPDERTDRVRAARDAGLALIELDGSVGVLANGAGLTMTTLDAVAYYGGRAANFLEIGGDAYTKATPALELVLTNPAVKSLVVNFCGAFARTDVMTEGVVNALQELKPSIPVSFSIHGTGEEEAIAMVRDRLGIEPYDRMDDAVKAAVDAAALPEEVA